MTHRLRHRIGRLEQAPQQQRVIVMSIVATEQDRDDLVDQALAAADIVAGPSDLVIKTLRFCPVPGDPPVQVVSASAAVWSA